MGYSRRDDVVSRAAYTNYVSTNRLDDMNTRREEIFRQRVIHQMLDPKGITLRESRDSEQNPNSTALAFFVDVTGSMGTLAERLVRTELDKLMNQVYERKPVSDPHILFGGIGDVECDRAPLQLSQFEADVKVLEQLRLLYLEGGGGGNNHESYTLPWYFMAEKTGIDCWERRQKKGYLFTMGDECISETLSLSRVENVLGYRPQGPLDARSLFEKVSEKWEVFHLMVEEGDYYSAHPVQVRNSWAGFIGNRAIPMRDHTKMSEIITSIIQVNEGAEEGSVVGSWADATTNAVVREAMTAFRPGRVVDIR